MVIHVNKEDVAEHLNVVNKEEIKQEIEKVENKGEKKKEKKEDKKKE